MNSLIQLVEGYMQSTELTFQNITSEANQTRLSNYRLGNVDVILGDTMTISGDSTGIINLDIKRAGSSH